MANSIASQLVTMQNATSQQQAKQKTETGATTTLGQDVFLQLMMEELKNQDPLEPMDNKDFLTQQAQFTQVSSLQNIESALTSYNQYSQAASMIGRDVVLQDPDNEENYIYGNVEAVNLSGKDTSIVVDGKTYPLSSIVQIQANTATAAAASEENI